MFNKADVKKPRGGESTQPKGGGTKGGSGGTCNLCVVFMQRSDKLIQVADMETTRNNEFRVQMAALVVSTVHTLSFAAC